MFIPFTSFGTNLGRTAGGLYAGASAGHNVGASAALGGGLDGAGGYGGSGAESHAGGISKKVVKLDQLEGGAKSSVILEKSSVPQSTHQVSGSYSANVGFDTRSNFADNQQPQVVHQHTVVKQVAPVHHQTTIVKEIEPVQHVKTIYKKKVLHRPHKVN